uniref:FH2 domain-containing protein n=1 Tax=Trichuris muris TaxID=70415 RepID=A0A5S6Q0C8_TRIMR
MNPGGREKSWSFFGKVSGSFRSQHRARQHRRMTSDLCQGQTGEPEQATDAMYQSTASLPMMPSHSDIDAMDYEQVENIFEDMLDDMNLTEAKKAPLRDLSVEQKRAMISQKIRTDQTARGGKVKCDDPADYIRILSSVENADRLLATLRSLRVSLSNNPISWIKQFGRQGLNLLLGILSWTSQYNGELVFQQSEHECIKCLRAFMNNNYGLGQILGHPDSCRTLVQSLSVDVQATMIDVVKLLAAICVVPARNEGAQSGHEKILEAFSCPNDSDNRKKLAPILAALAITDNPALQNASMQLVNAIVIISDDLDLRLHLSNAFMRAGLADLIEVLEASDSAGLKRQVKIFTEHRDADLEELYQQHENLRIEMDTPRKCYEMLERSFSNAPTAIPFLSILQHLLLIRGDEQTKMAYLKLLEEMISYTVLNRSSYEDGYRRNKRFSLNVEDVLEKVMEGNRYESLERPLSKNIQHKLETLITEKQELQAKMAQILEKMAEYEAETVSLRKYIESDSDNSLPPLTQPLSPATVQFLSRSDWPKSRSKADVVPTAPPPPPPPPLPPTAKSAGIPPPPAPGSIPPPPPPPMLPGGSVRFPTIGKPTASLATGIPSFLKQKQAYKAEATLRKVNWRIIKPSELTEHAFWARSKEDKLKSDNLFKILESQFSTSNAVNGANRFGTTAFRKAKSLQVLEEKAGKALDILQGSTKMSAVEWKKAILEVDESVLSESALQQLIINLPDGESLERIKAFNDCPGSLADVEQFVLTLVSIHRLKPRLRCVCFKLKFAEMVDDVKPSIVAVVAACEEIRASRGFSTFLELLLLVGNYMNSSSKGPLAYGYHFQILAKLTEIRSVDQSKTLLHVLIDTMGNQYPEQLRFTDDFIHVKAAAEVPADVLASNLREMQRSIQLVENELKQFQPQSESDRFEQLMSRFLSEAREQYQLLEKMHEKMLDAYGCLMKYFAFDPKNYAVDHFFGDLSNFKTAYEGVLKENEVVRMRQERVLQAEASRRLAEQQRRDREMQKIKLMAIAHDNEEGVMDSLLEAISTGQAFPQRFKAAGVDAGGSHSRRRQVQAHGNSPALTVDRERVRPSPNAAGSGVVMKVRRAAKSATKAAKQDSAQPNEQSGKPSDGDTSNRLTDATDLSDLLKILREG